MLTTLIDWEKKSRIVIDLLNMILVEKVMDVFQHDICFPMLTFPSPWQSIDEPSSSSLFIHLLERSQWSTIFEGENPKTWPMNVMMPRDTEIPTGIVHMSHSMAVELLPINKFNGCCNRSERIPMRETQASEATFYWTRKKMDTYQTHNNHTACWVINLFFFSQFTLGVASVSIWYQCVSIFPSIPWFGDFFWTHGTESR